MKHYASPSFWECYAKLSKRVQDVADKNFELLKENPHQPILHLKKVERYYSVRIGQKYRALAVEIEEGFLWFWIGTHTEYDNLLK